MKKIGILLVMVALVIGTKSFGQGDAKSKKDVVLYTVFVNVVPDHFDLPLIGFINLAKGSQQSVHVGFMNTTENNLKGAQVGFINTTGGFVSGTQVGFLNTCSDSLNGYQVGFINTGVSRVDGAQIGFLNTATQKVNGAQVGFINSCDDALKGSQVGFLNTTKKSVNGIQLGFINIADTISQGIPLGFLSIVKKGGYQAVEISCTETYPINVSYKIGIKKFYTTFVASYNSDLNKQFAFGAGFGSIMPLNKSVYFNPEFITTNVVGSEGRQLMSLTTNLGFSISKKMDVLVGPSVVWNRIDNSSSELNKPFYSIYNTDINDKNKLIVGCRLAIRYNLSK